MSDTSAIGAEPRSGRAGRRPVLECQGLDVGYGKLTVARDITFTLKPEKVLTILGPNGAGKTTLLMTLAGFLPPRAGTITLNGEPVKGSSPRRMNQAGMVLIPDFRALFTELTPIQNLKLAAHAAPIWTPCSSSSPHCSGARSSGSVTSRVASSRCWPSHGRLSSRRSCC